MLAANLPAHSLECDKHGQTQPPELSLQPGNSFLWAEISKQSPGQP